ncbi:MAG: hypothetical protein LAP85_26465 [Acidobacteriia bacterium]|jgi:hypothetical protein|nr:hypothetical protein [Terriglobia bacterium]
MGYLDLAREALKDKGRILDGHKVDRVIWETDKAIVFEDAEGRFWRYLASYGKAWPVIIEGMKYN